MSNVPAGPMLSGLAPSGATSLIAEAGSGIEDASRREGVELAAAAQRARRQPRHWAAAERHVGHDDERGGKSRTAANRAM